MKKKGGGRVVHAAGGFVGMGGGAPRVDCLIFLRSIYYVSDCITWPRQHLNSHFFFFSKNTYEKIKNGQERERDGGTTRSVLRMGKERGGGGEDPLKRPGPFSSTPSCDDNSRDNRIRCITRTPE